MRKAVISNRIYMSLKPDMLDYLTKTLMYTFKVYSQKGGATEEFCDVTRVANVVSIPIGRPDLIPQEYIIVDKRVLPPATFNTFNAELRESQQEIHDTVEDNCLINASVGFGKTITALSLAHKFQTKTLVVVHTSFLLDQWVGEIKKWLDIDCGILGGGKSNLEPPIVVATIQSLSRKWDKLEGISTMFGLIIVDEVHKTPATSYTSSLNKFKARYKIGLSGTLKRKDGKGVLIQDYFGCDIRQPKQENVMMPSVDLIYTEERLEAKRGAFAEGTTKLSQNINYILLLASLCKIYSDRGHKILLVSDRVATLEALYDLVPNAVLITGHTKTEDREESVSRIVNPKSPFNIILGSIGIFKEGISINPLSCLILGCPTNNLPMLEQLVGRIMRKSEGKLNPVVVDIILKGGIAYNQANNRKQYYEGKNYKLTDYTNNAII